ncbi:MAG: adenylosuccinate synthase [Fibrobacteres bacterium]|nr:adenylosuccinate synthase [Fibrobacterota bacterium]
MANRVVVGAQWGDEGKAKIVDFLTDYADVVVRFQGGANAGHTVIVDGKKFVFHLIPAGIMHSDKVCVIGNGVVFEPQQFLNELDELAEQGMKFDKRLFISKRAILVMPYHKKLDLAREKSMGASKIGTTGRGIGPAYADKASRTAIRVMDLLNPVKFRERLREVVAEKNNMLVKLYGEVPYDADKLADETLALGEKLKPYIADTTAIVNKALKDKKRLLFEGAQGTILDIDHGSYPYVTSSNTVAAAACTGSGIGPTRIDEVIGVVKAYTTRVGNGPFPTEFDEEMGTRIRTVGGEFGATTGRPRRCGWFDAVLLRRAADLNGLTSLAITKMDVLDAVDIIKICVGYELDGVKMTEFPDSLEELERVKPVYEEMPGWMSETKDIKEYSKLPEKAKKYLKRLSDLVEVPTSIISVGPDRNQTILIANF